MKLLTVLFAFPLAAAVADLAVVGATSTQIAISYNAPSAASCTVEASKRSDYSLLALDVDTAYYPSANSDSRPGNINYGRQRIFVIGKQGPSAIEMALDGYNRSRSLQADTDYYVRVTCGADQAAITARTANILMGDARGEALAVDTPFKYKQVTANPVAMAEFNDPYTGALIKQHAPLLGFSYAVSTKDSPHADCNQTLSGVKASCKFIDAAGAGWTATTGTLADAVRASDSNFAEYSGASQQPLFLRLGSGKVPDNTSVGEFFSWQNIILRGYTSDIANGGGEIEVCVTLDGDLGQCASPWRTVTLTTTDATYRICHDSPCTNAEKAGDFMTFQDPSKSSKFARSRVYNQAGSLNTIRFAGSNGAADCNRLYVGEPFYAQNTAANGDRPVYTFTVSAKSCASTPPQVTVAQSIDMTHNGTTGVGWFIEEGIGSNHYGVLIRKKSTSSTSTVRIGYALWRAAWSLESRLNFASGGFGKKCQTVPTPAGYYLCITGHPGNAIGIKPTADGLDIVNYGVLVYRPDVLIGPSMAPIWTYCTVGGNDMSWDDATPGRFYCYMPTAYPNPASGGTVDNRKTIVMLDLALTVSPAANPDGYSEGGGSPAAVVSNAVILGPCLNACASVNDDFTFEAQIKRYSTDYDPKRYGSCGTGGVQGNVLFGGCGAGSQNSAGWLFAWDLGNRQPIGGGFVGSYGNTQHVFAGLSSSGNVASRWCGSHTGQTPAAAGGAKFTIVEVNHGCGHYVTSTASLPACTANANPGTCSPCPDVTLDGFNYNGKNWCSALTVSSTWDPGWGSTPSNWEVGDPVQSGCSVSPNFYYDQKLQVGDVIQHGGEVLRIIERISNTSFKVIRGWGSWYDNITWGTKTHSTGASFGSVCYTNGKDPTTANPGAEGGSPVWYYEMDPTGSDPNYTFLSNYHNHAFHFEGNGGVGYGVKPKGSSRIPGGMLAGVFAFNDNSLYKSLFTGVNAQLGVPANFAGKGSFCYGNSCETHPGAQQVLGDAVAKSWFHDIHPRLFHPGTEVVTLVPGKSHTYKIDGGGTYIDPKHFDLEVFSGRFPLQMTDILTDSSDSTGKACVAVLANDCFAGSTAGKFYFVSDIYDTTWSSLGGCRENLFNAVQVDICVGNTAGSSASVVQYRFPSENSEMVFNGSGQRILSKEGRTYHESATENVHSDPTGHALLTRGYRYIVPPRFPGRDSRNRGTFTPVPVTLPEVPPGTATAVVEFGYTSSFRCSANREQSCVADQATLNEAVPFRFSHEAVAGLACSSGCSLTIPALSNRILYYRVKLRNAAGSTISTGPTQLQAVH